ncbi:MAG: ABC transporter substrate-binding protein [Deltaproteobacteria bacterium]|jgi:taurine transport system substrate-binding protein|nr:ABC transporter substrate-binding protein [Deltaproteobacteria bacterium]
MRPSILHLAALGALLAAFTPFAVSAAPSAKPETVRLAYLNGPRPWILGKADGSFGKALGVPVQWINFASGPEALKAVAAGEIDIARAGSVPAAAALARKLPIEVVAVSGVIDSSERLIARQSIKSVKELEGRTVTYPAGSTAHYALLAAFKVHGVDAAKVKQAPLKPADEFAAWKRGDVDAAYVWGPFSSQIESEGGHELLRSGQLQKDGYYLFNVYVVSKKFAAEHPDTVSAFLAVFRDTVNRYKANPDASAETIARELGQDVQAVKQTLAGLAFPDIKEQLETAWLGQGDGESGISKSLADTARFLADLGELSNRDLPASFVPFINSSYIAKAVR